MLIFWWGANVPAPTPGGPKPKRKYVVDTPRVRVPEPVPHTIAKPPEEVFEPRAIPKVFETHVIPDMVVLEPTRYVESDFTLPQIVVPREPDGWEQPDDMLIFLLHDIL